MPLIIAFARFIMDKTNNCTRRWKHEKAPHKANGIRSSIASNAYAFWRLRHQKPSDTANKSAPDAKVTATGAASAAETPVVLTETQEIEKNLTDQSPSNTS